MHEEKDKYDGFVIPAHILAHQAASTSVFVTSLYDRPYIIDPMTFILQNPKSAHVSDAGTIRPSVEKLFSDYHPKLIEKILTLSDDQTLSPKNYPDLGEFCQNCYNFQTKKVSTEVGETGAAKYLKRYKKTQSIMPRLVVPPYFCFANTSTDPFYAISLECAQIFQTKVKNIPVAPVVLCAPAALKSNGVAKITEDYAGFPTVLLWMDGFAQGQAQVADIVLVRKLIHELTSKGVKVETLYGGYLMATMCFDGLQALSHGVLYTQHKSHTLSPGSGGAPERYYIPGIWEFRSMSQTDIILHQHPDLMCNCAVCAPVLAGNPDNIVKFMDNPELLRRHFLTIRRGELDKIESSSAKNEAARFLSANRKYHEAFSALPNPDAMVSNAPIQGLDYLKNWADGITATV